MSLESDIAKFTSLVQDWASKTSDVFYSNTPQDVNIKVLNDLGDVVSVTIPNQKKMSDTFDAWKSSINVKNTNGTITDDLGGDVSVGKFGGLTLAEYDALYKTFINKSSVKIVPEYSTQMIGYFLQAVVTNDNRVIAWGWNSGNLLSYGLGSNFQSVIELQQPMEKQGVLISKIYVSGQHIGILYEDGDLYLRGVQSLGHFGIGNTSTQIKFVFSHSDVVEYITSANGDQDGQPMAAVILTNGDVMTAGDNGHGELGIGSNTNTYTWSKSYDAAANANDKALKCLVNGDDVACFFVLTEAGQLWVSGHNGYGQLGTGNTTNLNTLTKVNPTIDGKIIEIVSSGYYDASYYGHTHILTDTGHIYATGYNNDRSLCMGGTTNLSVFTEVQYATAHDIVTDKIVSIYAYDLTTAYLTASGELYAGGYNSRGSIGDGTSTHTDIYIPIMSNVKKFYPLQEADASQYPFMYVITNDNKLYTYGNGNYGKLLNNGTANKLAPSEVPFSKTAEILSIYSSGYSDQGTVYIHTSEGFIYGAGQNNYGQITPTFSSGYVSSLTRIKI
jgi:alpha-tubulin suppressor-like RCC1 family protein